MTKLQDHYQSIVDRVIRDLENGTAPKPAPVAAPKPAPVAAPKPAPVAAPKPAAPGKVYRRTVHGVTVTRNRPFTPRSLSCLRDAWKPEKLGAGDARLRHSWQAGRYAAWLAARNGIETGTGAKVIWQGSPEHARAVTFGASERAPAVTILIPNWNWTPEVTHRTLPELAAAA